MIYKIHHGEHGGKKEITEKKVKRDYCKKIPLYSL